jgi:succinoglycan biosynthesis protein ExoO
MPYVSVIIPAFNAADFIIEAYRSVVDQTIDHWEIIFVNDGSQDETLSTIRSIADIDPRVKLIDLPSNIGPAGARNAAIEVASGRWIAMLDADDHYSGERLEVLTGIAEKVRADIVLDNQFIVDPISRQVIFTAFDSDHAEAQLLDFSDFLRNTQADTVFDFGYLKPILNREWLIANQIRYQEQLRLGEDSMLLFECYARGGRVALVPKPYYYYNFQYSHISQTQSPTTRTEASCEPLLAAEERFLEKYKLRQSCVENRLIASACEALRGTISASAFRECLRHWDIIGLIRYLVHPIRLLRGIYFDKRRGALLRQRARQYNSRKLTSDHASAHKHNASLS